MYNFFVFFFIKFNENLINQSFICIIFQIIIIIGNIKNKKGNIHINNKTDLCMCVVINYKIK